MTQVVDASAVVAFLIDSGTAGRQMEAEIVTDDLAAPDLMPFEAANIVRRTLLRGEIDQTTARQALDDLLQLDVDLIPFAVVAERAYELRDNLTIYDASYVGVAELVEGRLLTLDRRLATAAGPRCNITVLPSA